jgi:hypothetical protein
MRFQTALMPTLLSLFASVTLAYVPATTQSGANRRWASGTIPIQFTGPTILDGHAVHGGVRNAMASWNAIAHARIVLTAGSVIDRREPAIGNGKNEFGWVESSDSPYFIPGVPCTTATIYDTVTGVMNEADTTCNAMAFQWPDNLFGLYTQEGVADAESAALAAFGSWLGLDASLQYGDPMYPATGPGAVLRSLSADELAFGRHQYGDGTSPHGAIGGTVRFPDGSPIPYAYVCAIGAGGHESYGAVASVGGTYVIFEMTAGSYAIIARPLTTDPYILSSVPYRANPIRNLDFTPEYYGGGLQVPVLDGSTTLGLDITASRSGSHPDAHEPNGSAATASPLTLGVSKLATTHAASDEDWYWFQTAANTCYVLASGFHGASIVSTQIDDAFWSRTRLSVYDGAIRVSQNESRDVLQLDPGNWITYCESGSGRRLDLAVAQREPVGGAGFFYTVVVQAVAGGSALTPTVAAVYPSSGWSNRNRFVWIDGAGFMPGSKVDIRLPNAAWVAASQVIATRCDATYHCSALKALFPSGTPGLADVKVTNPNGHSVTKTAAFAYLAAEYGPLADRTPQAFGARYGQGKAVCVGDYDGDGSDDILKTRNGFLPYQLFRNNRNGTFTDVASSSGLHLYSSVFGKSCSFIDVDDDGDLDAYITNVAYSLPSGSANELYTNQLADGGNATFALGTPAGLGGAATRYKSDAAWADFNNDGRLDVVLAYDTYAGSAPYYEALQYFRQDGNGSFTNVTGSSGLSGYFASIMSVTAADFNNDGCEDLVFFTNAGLANRLYKGNCHGYFTDVTSQAHIAEGAPWCTGVAVADFNNDAKADIFCGSYNSGAGPVRPRLWLNNGSASFTDRASEAGLYAVARNMDVVLAFDEDDDGLTDVYVGASENGWLDDRKDVLLRNTGGNPPVFADVTDAADMYPTTQDGTGYCGAGVDEFYCDRDATAGGVFDGWNDGALDVFVTGDDPDFLQRGSDFLWENRRNVIADGSTTPTNDWIEVALKGANTRQSRVLSNRFGIGARVTVISRFNLPAGAVPTETECLQNPLPTGVIGSTKEVLAGNRSQSSTVLHFGLGVSMPFGQKRVDCIKVAWPSGLERAYTGITANTKVVLAEDAGRMKVINVVPNSGPNTRSDPTTITGLRFDRDVAAAPQVLFGAVPATAVTFVSEHELTVLPPMWQSPGTVDVTVVNTDGERDTLLSGYTYTGSSAGVRFKDPVPSMITVTGEVTNSPSFVAARGVERTGVIADGITQLVLEAEVGGPGRVRFVLDDDDSPGNTPPPGTSVGTTTALGGGAPQTTLTVPVTVLVDGRYFAHAVYTAPQDFIRTAADSPLATRPVRVRGTFIDASNAEYAMPPRSLDLYRVPVLYVHGMWGSTMSFEWPILNDARWIIHRADYSATNDVAFSQNVGMPPRVIAELRKEINDRGIAGTRFFVFAHSMGAVLFKIYMGGAGAPYARTDNFFSGDVYALVSVDAPFFGSYFAPFVGLIQSSSPMGSLFTYTMRSLGLAVDRGCMQSLDPASPDTLGIPATGGTFHAIVGWGGGEMRDSGVELAAADKLALLKAALGLFNFGFENSIVQCGSGDDFIVCTDSQKGGLSGSYVSNFHFENLSARAIHLDSMCNETAPSATAEHLLETPTTNGTEWGHLLPAAPPTSLGRVFTPPKASGAPAAIPNTGNDGVSLALGKGGDDVTLTWVGAATRLMKSLSPTLAAGVCLAVSGNSATDAHQLSVPTNAYYAVGAASLCTPEASLSIASISPASGSTMGGYPVTLLGTGFDATVKVRIGAFNAIQVVVVNATTITFRVPPGNPGSTTVTVINGAGQMASRTFTYTNPGPAPGGVAITAPADGAVVAAGSTISVSAIGSGGFTIARALVSSAAFASDDDQDAGAGFTANVTVPADSIGPLAIGLVAKDATSNFKTAAPVTITVVAPGNVAVVRLDAEKLAMLYATPTRQLRVYGIYSDGVRRDLTHAPGILYEMDTQDPRKPNYPYNGTGVAVVDAAGMVTAKTHGSTVCHVTYYARKIDVVVEVADIRPTVTLQKPGFISWPYQGPGVTYDVVRGKLSGLRATGGNFADPSIGMTCIKDDFVNVTAADAANPPAGDGYLYLMRESRTLSYEESPFWATRSQSGQRTAEINAAPGHCP